MNKKQSEARDESTALAVPEEAGLPANAADYFDLKENMRGVDVRLPQIGIIHQGQMFRMPDGEPMKSFTGVILDISKVNAWWERSFDESGGGTPPQCSSIDGVSPSAMSENVQANTCAACPQNKYGSDGGRGKACKNMKRVHVLLEGDMIPSRLTVPPSNLRPIDNYVTLLTSKATPYQAVKTEFGLKKVSNKDGIVYSELVLTVKEKFAPKEWVAIREIYQQMKPIMREQEIAAEERN